MLYVISFSYSSYELGHGTFYFKPFEANLEVVVHKSVVKLDLCFCGPPRLITTLFNETTIC